MTNKRLSNLLYLKKKQTKIRQHLGINLRSWQCSAAFVILPLARGLSRAVKVSNLYLKASKIYD